MEWLEKADREIFLLLNGWHHPWVDAFFWITSLVITWIPLYLFFIFLIIRKYNKKSWVVICCAAVLVFSTDRSSVWIKNSVQRYRPSNNLEIQAKVHLINNEKGGQYGFVSSHAANVWGVAAFVLLVLNKFSRCWLLFIFLWAATVSYGRIYAGLHYPGDVVGGALLGFFIAVILFKIHDTMLTKLFNQELSTESNLSS